MKKVIAKDLQFLDEVQSRDSSGDDFAQKGAFSGSWCGPRAYKCERYYDSHSGRIKVKCYTY